MSLTGDELTQVVVNRFRANANAFDIEHVADFCGVNPPAVAGWLRTRKPLGGIYTLKLWHFLAQAGVDSPELVEARNEYPLGEYFGRLLAFNLLSLEDACALCKVKRDAILRAARNQGRLLHCSKTFKNLTSEYDELLALAVEEFQEKLPSMEAASGDSAPALEVVQSIPSGELEELRQRLEILEARPHVVKGPHSDEESALRLQLVKNVAEALQAAHVAANVAISQFSLEERELLRTLMGAKGMFEFSTVLDRLCSERALHHKGV